MKYIGIDIGGTNLKAGLVDETGQLLATRKMKVAGIADPAALAWTIHALSVDLCKDFGCELTDIFSIGVGCPGAVEIRGGSILYTCNLPLRNVPLRRLFHQLSDLPLYIENDANCAAMAEKLSGNAVKLDDFALITIDSGVGGALFLDGRIRRGKDWRAGELGMMIPNYETGGFHTMQDYLSTIVLAEEYAKEFDVPTGSIVPATLFHRLDEPRVRKIVDRWIDYLAIGIFNIVAVADPECVLLGGGICREQQLLPLVNAALDKIPQWSDFHTVVKRCRHTNNAGLIGAYYAFETEVEGMEKVPIR